MAKLLFLINITTLLITLTLVRKISAYSYDETRSDGPTKWGKINANCDGLRQSPINIDFASVVNGNSSISPLRITRFLEIADSITVDSEDHSFEIIFNYRDGKPAQLIGGPLTERYNIKGIHFHWGANDLWGSEHALNGRKYAAEAHVVSFNEKYSSISDAISKPDGLAVLGVLMELENHHENRIFDLASKVIEANTFYTNNSVHFSINDIIGHEDCIDREFRVLTYLGSLTTPGCAEVVTWMVALNPVKISTQDLASLRNLRDEEGNPILNNVRPLQELNKRVVIFQ